MNINHVAIYLVEIYHVDIHHAVIYHTAICQFTLYHTAVYLTVIHHTNINYVVTPTKRCGIVGLLRHLTAQPALIVYIKTPSTNRNFSNINTNIASIEAPRQQTNGEPKPMGYSTGGTRRVDCFSGKKRKRERERECVNPGSLTTRTTKAFSRHRPPCLQGPPPTAPIPR
jgi:hypothetical protein